MSDSAQAPAAWIRQTLSDAFAALGDGKPAEAGALCRRVLAAAPELAEAHFLVGLVALELDDRGTAVAAFGTVTRLRPTHGAAWAQLAWLHARSGRTVAASRALDQAERHAGAAATVAERIGRTAALLERHDRARDWFERAVRASPDRADYRLSLASAELFLGATDAAEAALSPLLAAVPEHAHAHWLLAGLRPARDRRHASVLEQLIKRPEQPQRALALLGYALGKELEDLGEWDAAFAAYEQAAKARRTTVVFDEAAEVALYDALEATYHAGWLADRPVGERDSAPIFIIGQPRSGTTLVERVIVAHSAVQSAGELQQFGLAVRGLGGLVRGMSVAERVQRAAQVEPAALGRAYLDGCAPLLRASLPRFVDKLPGNFLNVPLILAALPDARIVHLVREPLDACFASFKQLFADGYPHSYEMEEQARHFVRYHRLMAHWRREFPGRFLDVSYEALVADFDAGARRLIHWLGLPWEDACLAFHTAGGAVATASAAQVREPVHSRSVGRWRQFGAHLEPMRVVLHAAGLAP